jgi:hypothetical protein
MAVSPDGETRIDASSSIFVVQVAIATRAVGTEKSTAAEANARCGERKSCSVIDNLEIVVNKHRIIIPQSSYMDLIDPRDASVEAASNGQMKLLINGSDASDGYHANIDFDSERVVGRTLFSALSPSEPLEKTSYFLVTVGD